MLSAMYENGGNTTHRFLDGHPQLFVYPFESQMGTGVIQDHLTSCVPLRYRWSEFIMDGTAAGDYESFWDEEMKSFLRVPQRSKFNGADLQIVESERKALFVKFMEGRPRSRANLVSAFFFATFESWKNVQRTGQEKYYVGYNPVQILDGEKILADFSTGHILHVVRNPWSGYADTKKRPFPLSLGKYAWLWSQSQYAALTAAERHPDRVHILRFEDLVASPRAVLQPLFAKMALDWSDSCLYPSWNGQKMGEVYPWGTVRAPTPEANIATMNELSAEEKREMASHVGVAARLTGYDEFLAKCRS
jgi:hypothetical protein